VNAYLARLRSISEKPLVRGLPKPSKGAYGSFGSAATSRIPENEPVNDARDLNEAQAERAATQRVDGGIDAALAGLLAQHGGFPGIDWAGLALISAAQSDLWIVQRPDGQLTLVATARPVPKPRSYTAAWPARFTSPEPVEDTAPAAEAAQAAIERACQVCWDCKHLDTTLRPSCSAGHAVVWQTARTRTHPRRADRIGPCPDSTTHET